MSQHADVLQAILSGGVAPDDVEGFYVWAFGEDWQTAPMSSADDRWNERHKDLLVVKGTDPRNATITKMARLYVEFKHG